MRYQSCATFLEVPWVAIAIGPDPGRNEMRGHARGIIAIGDMASGVVAFGGLSRGLIALGGLAMGYYVVGGAVFGRYVFGPLHQDPAAADFFSRLLHTILKKLGGQ